MDLQSIPANDLVSLCYDARDAAAWREFERRFQKTIALAVLRTARKWGGAQPELIEEFVQDVFVRLCERDYKVLRNFVPTQPDSITGFLIKISQNVTHDAFRAAGAQRAGGNMFQMVTEDGDLTFIPTPSRPSDSPELRLKMGDIDRVLESLMPRPVSKRDYIVFWLYHRQGFTAREISEIKSVGLTVKGVEASLLRSLKSVREKMSQMAQI